MPEGAIGVAFKAGKMFLDFDLSNNNSYDLTESQKQKIIAFGFWAAIPIFKDDECKKITGVISIDSESKINLNEERQKTFTHNLRLYAAFIDKNINL